MKKAEEAANVYKHSEKVKDFFFPRAKCNIWSCFGTCL